MNIKPTGEIVATEYRDFKGGLERVEWEWQGGDLAYFSRKWIHQGIAQISRDIINVGPFRLRIITQCWEWPGWIVAKDGLKARLIYRIYRCVRHTEIVYRRMILTAAVWHLAEYHQVIAPSWRDIYALDKMARWLGK